MKRIFFIFALLAMEVSINAQSVGVYVDNASGSTTNIRNAPKGKVVHRIPRYRVAMLEVESPVNGWWRICDNSYFSYEEMCEGYQGLTKLTGSRNDYWIHSSVIVVSTRNYDDETLYLYEQPEDGSKKVYTIREEIPLHPLDVRGEWVKCSTIDGKHVGWIQAEWLCGNPLTNCS